VIKIGFFDKIDNCTIADAWKELLNRTDREIFSYTMLRSTGLLDNTSLQAMHSHHPIPPRCRTLPPSHYTQPTGRKQHQVIWRRTARNLISRMTKWRHMDTMTAAINHRFHHGRITASDWFSEMLQHNSTDNTLESRHK